MLISRSLRSLSLTSARRAPQYSFNTSTRSLGPQILRTMSSTAPHPVSSTAEPPKAAEGLEPVTAGASSTPAAAKPAHPKEGKQAKPKKDKGGGGSSGPLELQPPPGYFEERIKIFDEWKAKNEAAIAG